MYFLLLYIFSSQFLIEGLFLRENKWGTDVMSQTTKHRPMKDKGEQVVSFFKEWLFGFFFFFIPPGTGRGKKLKKKVL